MIASEELKSYFQQHSTFHAVICDWVAIELYQAETIDDLRASLGVIGPNADRVLALKSGESCAKSSGRQAGLVRRMVDYDATKTFRHFCSILLNDDRAAMQHLQRMRQQSKESRDDAFNFAVQMPSIVNDLATNCFTEAELSTIRKRRPLALATIDKFMKVAEAVTLGRLRSQGSRLPRDYDELVNNFVFRLAVATLVRVLQWFRTGRSTDIESHNVEKTRNDHSDSVIATYATYFDGVLSNDSGLLRTYSETSAILTLMQRARG